MKKREIDTLKILQEIENNSALTQRKLSKKLNVSLGLVNIFMKQLIQKGYFKITTIPKNRVKYLLTPKGISEKSRLTLDYLKHSLEFYKEIKTLLTSTFKELENNQIKKLVIYGIGEITELAYLFLQQTNIELVGIVDDDKEGKKFFGFNVLKTQSLIALDLDIDCVLLATIDGNDEAIEKILETGIDRNKIIILKQ